MKLGIDFGTTRVVVAAVDRGNYPVVTFEDSDGTGREWFPPLVAAKGGVRVYGWDAWAMQSEPGWTGIRSLKRTLESAGPYTKVNIAGEEVPLVDVLTEMVAALKRALLESSSLPGDASSKLEVMLGVPANANSNQRFLTVEPFQRAGFSVLGVLNEPSAASIEYGHRNREAARFEQVLVYDLGGGTFDASLVRIDGRRHDVAASEGVADLGGDDFDLILSEMALTAAGIDAEELTQGESFRLHEECRAKKESLHPNTRRIVIDLSLVREDWPQVTVPVADFYECCRPLVRRSIEAAERLLVNHAEDARADALYVTGGGSELPLVARMLKEIFGRRVKRSAYTRSATAIGLAIQSDVEAGYVLRETFNRNFGVWRESRGGATVVLDILFPKGTPLPSTREASVSISRQYSPVHNVGHFRYLECSQTTGDGRPTGDIAVWDEIRFPFDPMLQNGTDPGIVPVSHLPAARGREIEESYSVTATGTVEVRISDRTSGYSRTYNLARWAEKPQTVVPGARKRARAEAR